MKTEQNNLDRLKGKIHFTVPEGVYGGIDGKHYESASRKRA